VSGHNKWSKIKHKKGAADAKRGKIFGRLIKEIALAARQGGGDIIGNARLRSAIAEARAENMPNDNIDRAIKRGTGELDGAAIEEFSLEGYGPGGVAMLVECASDNRVRTVSDVRSALTKHGGNMGEAGCVAWMFDKKGLLSVQKGKLSEDQVLEVALDAGAEDVQEQADTFDVITPLEAFDKVKAALDAKGAQYVLAKLTRIPQTQVPLDAGHAKKFLDLLSKIEDLDDVQNVWANFDIDDKILEQLTA